MAQFLYKLAYGVVLCVIFFAGSSAEFNGICRKFNQFKLSINSRRNITGHWIAQLQLEHGAETKEVGPWKVDVDHSTAKCAESETVSIVATVTAPPQRPGPDYELVPGLGYYKFHTDLKNWYVAREICAQEGAHLLIVNSEKEANALNMFWERHPKIVDGIRNDWAHIGMHDMYKEGMFVTIFNEPVSSTGYNKWRNTEPNGETKENCGDINRNGLLADVVCELELPFFCEQEL